MNVETIKSIALTILVMMSLLLSFLLWSYQPKYETVFDPSYVGEVDVGGKEKSLDETISPSRFVFQMYETDYGFQKMSDKEDFYNSMNEWVIYDYEIVEEEMSSIDGRQVNMSFAYDLPLEYLQSIFKFEGKEDLPNWSFNHISIGVNDTNQSLQIQVESKNKQYTFLASIDKTENYQQVAKLMGRPQQLQELMPFELADETIFIPKESFELPRRTLVANELNPNLFVNALFRDPSLVTQNRIEAVFTDGQRGMRILNDGKTMEYTNPIQSSVTNQNTLELLEWSIERINDHKGWTNDYRLDQIDSAKDEIAFRMTYDDYPIYDFYNIALLRQEWRDQNLFRYERTLVSLDNSLSSVSTELMSGQEVKQFIESQNINVEEIRDITIGYYLSTIDRHSFLLEPSWFIVYDDQWRRVTKQDMAQPLED